MTDEMISKIKSRYEKLQALAERGVGGEKETAKKKIEKLLAENGISEEDLNEEKTYYYLFSYSGAPYRKKLLNQIIYKVMGYESDYKTYRTRHTRNKVGIYCTPAQKLEIDLDYEFYSNLFDSEVNVLMQAFISKNNIYPDDAPEEIVKVADLTEEEKQEWLKRQQYANTLTKRARPEGYIEEKEE